jgi:hypothetical protein
MYDRSELTTGRGIGILESRWTLLPRDYRINRFSRYPTYIPARSVTDTETTSGKFGLETGTFGNAGEEL